MNIKRLVTCVVAVAFLLSVGLDVSAVEKKDKKEKTKKELRQKQVPSDDTQQKSVTRPESTQTVAPVEKKYDDFVDANNNGIDDRKENLKEKKTSDEEEKEKVEPNKR